MNLAEAEAFAGTWIAAWNSHDLERILTLYSDSIVATSPLIVERLGRPDGTIRSKSELRAYFARSLGPDSRLHFELIEAFAGVDSLALSYRNHRGQRVVEMLRLDVGGRIERAVVHHR